MKLTKDVINSQISAADIDQILALYKANYPTLNTIDVDVPLSSNAEFKAHGNNPSPLTVEDFEKLWITKCHNAGYSVYLRGAFCDAEGIYNFPILKADGATWKGKAMTWLNRVMPLLKSGDKIGIFPEATNNAFNGNLFLTGNLPDAYNSFFVDLINSIKGVVPAGVTVLITNNYSEIINGWAGAIPGAEGKVVVDHYGGGDTGARTVANMKANIEALHTKYNLPVVLAEWADIDNQGVQFVKDMCAMFSALPSDVFEGVVLWCGWESPAEGILTHSNGAWALNDKGLALKDFFAGTAPVPTPTPTPTPTPVPTTEQFIQVYGVSPMVGVTNKGRLWKLTSGKWSELPLPKF